MHKNVHLVVNYVMLKNFTDIHERFYDIVVVDGLGPVHEEAGVHESGKSSTAEGVFDRHFRNRKQGPRVGRPETYTARGKVFFRITYLFCR